MAGERIDVGIDDVDALIAAVIPEQRDRLDVQGEIARGGMATIHRGVDRALKRRVALKQLHAGHEDSLLAVRSLVREAQITGQLDHPNIVPVHELGVDERGRLFFTMKLVEGRSLRDLIVALRSTHERIDESGHEIATAVEHDDLLRLLDVFFKVLDAVAFAHSRGVVHCDLKPDNVMVGDYGQVYVMDWGIAKVMPAPVGRDPLARSNRVTDTLSLMNADANMIMGTPAYMSPEQARGDQRQIDSRSDVFALGAMLFEILTGHPPYQGRNAVDVLLQAELAEVELPAHLPIARELRRIVGVAMAPPPVERYASVEAMQGDLQGFMRGGGNFPRQTFAPNEWIIREHEAGDAAYILISGRCEVFKQIDNEQRSLRTLGPGDVFGETAILASTRRTASVLALTEVIAVIVTARVLEREVDAMKPWMGAFIRALAQRFSEVARPVIADARIPAALQHATPSHASPVIPSSQPSPPNPAELSSPAQVANQAMMLLKTWGKWDRDLGNAMSLQRACKALAITCGLSEAQILLRLQSFEQFMIEPKHDSISLHDDRSLIEQLRQVLEI
jgi:eukaryotic-like serine/threonine-protein kinase